MKQAITFLLSFFFVLFRVHAQDLLAVPASSFLDEVPKGNLVTTASEEQITWLFNNTGNQLKSSGEIKGSFKVAVDDKVTDSVFGKRRWEGKWKSRSLLVQVPAQRRRQGRMVFSRPGLSSV